jgi:O-acetyl-ADP-ribose deacetylase (regulator of RNase III)
MPVEQVQGDLFRSGEKALAHGCNCAEAMGKGIAVEFKKRWPRMYDEYHRRCEAGTFSLGDVFVWQEGDATIFNLGTQRTWRTGATLDAVEKSLRNAAAIAKERKIRRIAMPRIAAGLGGLDWDAVKAVIDRVATDTGLPFVVYTLDR